MTNKVRDKQNKVQYETNIHTEAGKGKEVCNITHGKNFLIFVAAILGKNCNCKIWSKNKNIFTVFHQIICVEQHS